MKVFQLMNGRRRLKAAAVAGAMLGILLLAYACSKDDEGPQTPSAPTATCNVPNYLYHGVYNPIADTLSIGPACVNPNDPDDIIFYHQGSYKLYRYHRVSGEFSAFGELTPAPLWSLKWNDDGMFAYSYSGNNGEIRIFTSVVASPALQVLGAIWPAWGPGLGQMVYNDRDGFQAEWFTYLGAATDFTDRDTLATYLSGDRAWVSPDTIFHGGQVYNISNGQLVDIVETFGVHHTTAVDQSHFYTADRNTLYYLDAATSTYEVVQEWTNCEGFTHIQYHAGMDKLFATRVRRESFAATNALIEVRDLVWLNRDGTVYEEVDLVELLYPE